MQQKLNFKDGLREGITLILSNWPLVKLAVEGGWASQGAQQFKSQARQQAEDKKNKFNKSENEILKDFIEELYDFAYNYAIEESDVQNFLLEYMEDHFFCIIEDNSEKMIAQFIVSLVKDLDNDSNDVLNQIREYAEKLKGKKIDLKAQNNSDSEDEQIQEEDEEEYDEDEEEKFEEEETEEERQKREALEDDGFTVIPQKSKKKKQPQETEEERQRREELEDDGFTVVKK